MDSEPKFGGARRTHTDLRLTFVPPYGPSADPVSSLRSGEGSSVRLGQYATEEKSTCSRRLKVFLALCGLFLVIAAIVTLSVVLTKKSDSETDDLEYNGTLLPDKVTESGDYHFVVEPDEFAGFQLELTEPSDVEVVLRVDSEDDDVAMAVYARLGLPPTHVLYDDVQTIIGGTASRRRRALSGVTVSARFLALGAGRWFFELFNAGQNRISLPGAVNFEKAVCPSDCSSNGKCTAGRCDCDEGWQGEDCSQLASCPTMTCSTQGTLQPDLTCQCQDGWTGQFCENNLMT